MKTEQKTIEVCVHGKLGTFDLDVAFKAPITGITALFGPSGCGKTSVLRAIAGLNHLNGKISIGDDIWQDDKQFVPIYKRKIGYVFQEASLFPHLNVRKNLCYAFDKSLTGAKQYFDEVVDMLNIGHLIDRSPKNLSGGERQRVAIGRALLSSPQVLLMDEPLSALDMATRTEIMPFIERLRDQLKLPIFYITHDINEVERLADTLILMEQGKLLGAGKLQDLQADMSLPLAQQRNAAVNLNAHIDHWDEDSGLCAFSVKGARFFAPLEKTPQSTEMRIRIAANDVSISLQNPQKTSILNVINAVILSKTSINSHEILVSLSLGDDNQGAHILCRLSRYSWQNLNLKIGMKIFAQVKGIALLGMN
ncbi:molybdenum ABC transporter ATP-binding protein [Bartonella sp. HY329]|uniref:molybdenum ABC transporter ATP-binding protein n=1 Tax=unclassified Bartonella TaxID=2645622 RepID=UPI0021C8FF87|nr:MULTISPECIES: molybdenum ABC transporter ATP-binding protein [unclassified Bartonella]UXM94947.1 molybdenum ABC transporter ATP-binding protein [Bartonella sp. HY329]UXN09270.1 molybdenum ABC transporter ATP-binding protein [Bartonella sp. HY328]